MCWGWNGFAKDGEEKRRRVARAGATRQSERTRFEGVPVGAVGVTTTTAGAGASKWGAGIERGVRGGRGSQHGGGRAGGEPGELKIGRRG